MSRKLKTAVIGVGYLGNFHAQKHKNNPHVQLVGVCDFTPAQADKIAADLGVASVHRAQDLIGQVDAVTIAASTLSHYELAKLFLQNGVHVNVEKPITATLPQARELIDIAQQKKLHLAVGHIERFNPAILDLKKHIQQPKLIELTRYATYKTRGADVSVLHDLMIHDLDLLFWLTQSEIASMTAVGSLLVSKELDTGSVSIQMKNGIHALIQVSRVCAAPQRSLKITQAQSILHANTGNLEIEKYEATTGAEPVKITRWTVQKEDALQKETDAFVDAVLNNTPLAVGGEDGYKALEAVEQIQKMMMNNL